jgi:hypothetical protein
LYWSFCNSFVIHVGRDDDRAVGRRELIPEQLQIAHAPHKPVKARDQYQVNGA